MWYCRGFPSHEPSNRTKGRFYLLHLLDFVEIQFNRGLSAKHLNIDRDGFLTFVDGLDSTNGILPCTGNTLAKLANGITDTPALMAAKAHLRNNKPLLLSLSTNDALGMNMKNIGLLLNTKNIYFVPFGQDDPEKKPNSMTAHTDLLIPALEAALENRQLQPVIRDIVKK